MTFSDLHNQLHMKHMREEEAARHARAEEATRQAIRRYAKKHIEVGHQQEVYDELRGYLGL